MLQDVGDMQAIKPAGDDSEPYRRLIELQKQMIGLVQQHEKTKRECAALRAQLLEEMAGPRRGLRQDLGRLFAGARRHAAASWKPRATEWFRLPPPSLQKPNLPPTRS